MRSAVTHCGVGLALVFWCFSPSAVCAQTAQSRGDLVPPNYQPVNDGQGIMWMPANLGTLGTNGGTLTEVGYLTIAGSVVRPQKAEMTRDQGEYVYSGVAGNVQITQRIKIDAASSSARIVLTFTNNGSSHIPALDVAIGAQIRTTVVPYYYSDSGAAAPATLDDASQGVVFPDRIGNRAAVGFWLGAAKSKSKPVSLSMNTRLFQATYRLNLPRGETGSIAFGVVQLKNVRPFVGGAPSGNIDAKVLASFMTPFEGKAWTSDLPAEVRRSLVNTMVGERDVTPGGPPLKAMLSMLGQAGIDRGDWDTLVVDKDTRLKGTVSDGKLSIAGNYGNAELSLEEVALMIGGAGQGRPMRIYLRNGEIIIGHIKASGLVLKTADDLKVDLIPDLFQMLALHVSPADDRPPEKANALVTTLGGDRLGVRLDPDSKMTVQTAWGALTTALVSVESIAYENVPQPGFRLALSDQTRLSVFLTGPPLELTTTRWGKVRVLNHELRRWERLVAADPFQVEEEATPKEVVDASQSPHLQMAGDNLLVGKIVERELDLITADGVQTIETSLIESMSRRDQGGFVCRLTDGGEVIGTPQEALITVQYGTQQWRVPVRQIIRLRGADKQKGAAGEKRIREILIPQETRRVPANSRQMTS